MKITVNGGMGTFEVEGNGHAEIWEQLASLAEAFGEKKCGKCNSEDIRHVVRENEGGDKFYELHCQNCRARLRMSVTKKDKQFFPKRKAGKDDASGLAEGTYLPHNGWMKFDKASNKEV
jgi:hypothetical protein